jgi:hypothetical protein
MNIQIDWLQPFDLFDGHREGLIYGIRDEDQLPDSPGVYVFARVHGRAIFPLYIGRAANLCKRLGQQLNNLRLMRGIQQAPTGTRTLYIGELILRPGQRLASVLRVTESALINAALAEGFDILNIAGTNTLVHTIGSKGNREARDWLPNQDIHLRRGA